MRCVRDGALGASPGRQPVHVAARQVAVVDPTGAGDSFCGGLAAGFALGEDIADAVRRACATASAAIGAAGSSRLLDRAAIAHDLPPELDNGQRVGGSAGCTYFPPWGRTLR